MYYLYLGVFSVGRDSIVDVATGYKFEGTGFETQWL